MLIIPKLMKIRILHFFTMLLIIGCVSCSSTIEENDLENWIRKNDFEKNN